jgi:hypothetical protein
MIEVVGKGCRRNENTFYVQKLFSFSKNHAVCEVMWKNVAEPDSTQMTTGRMCFACLRAG